MNTVRHHTDNVFDTVHISDFVTMGCGCYARLKKVKIADARAHDQWNLFFDQKTSMFNVFNLTQQHNRNVYFVFNNSNNPRLQCTQSVFLLCFYTHTVRFIALCSIHHSEQGQYQPRRQPVSRNKASFILQAPFTLPTIFIQGSKRAGG